MTCVLNYLHTDVIEIIVIITKSLFTLEQVRCINTKINDCNRIERTYDAFSYKIEGSSDEIGWNRIKYKVGKISHRSYDKPYYISDNSLHIWKKMGRFYRKKTNFDRVSCKERFGRDCDINKPFNIHYNGKQEWNINRHMNGDVLPDCINRHGIRQYHPDDDNGNGYIVYDTKINILDDNMLNYFLDICGKGCKQNKSVK